jgi:hypothetical protein
MFKEKRLSYHYNLFTLAQNLANHLIREEPCGRDRRASKSKFKQPDLLKVFSSNSSTYIGTAAETAGCNIYKTIVDNGGYGF